jgi:hypothetical protein
MKVYDWQKNYYSLPKEAGVYILMLKRKISKIYKKDPKGILYIGETENLSVRLKAARHKNWEVYYEKDDNSLMFNHSLLTFAVDINENYILRPHKNSIDGGILKKTDRFYLKYTVAKKGERKEIEKKLLLGHLMLFGQLPPFNIKGPTLKYIWNKIENDNEWKNAMNYYNKTIEAL